MTKNDAIAMNVTTYLKRIEYSQPVKADRATLDGLVQAHLRAVPFENLDQQMGVRVPTALERIYEKIVLRNRGGWCFELNGLFGWLLKEIGFDVSILAGHVRSGRPSSTTSGDHMLLKVECDGPLLVDVGFGGGSNGPIPLKPCTVSQPPYTISVSDEGDGWYKYSEFADGNDGTYWFTLDPVTTSYFEAVNDKLQSDRDSPFRRTLTAQRRFRNRHVVVRGLVKKTVDETGTKTEHLPDSTALVSCLEQDFHLNVPDIKACWSTLRRRHQELFEK